MQSKAFVCIAVEVYTVSSTLNNPLVLANVQCAEVQSIVIPCVLRWSIKWSCASYTNVLITS